MARLLAILVLLSALAWAQDELGGWRQRLMHGSWQQQVDHPEGKRMVDTWTYRFLPGGRLEGVSFGATSVPFTGTWELRAQAGRVLLCTRFEGRQGGNLPPSQAQLSGEGLKIRLGTVELEPVP